MQKIDQNSFIPFLLEAIPERHDAWIDFQNEWKEESELPHYLFLADIANHVVENSNSVDLEALFSKIENIEEKGDDYSKEACTIGLLEGMQNNLLKNEMPLTIFDHYMEPTTKRMWTKVIEFWEAGKLIRND